MRKSEYGVLFPARDGYWSTNFVDRDVELSQTIEGLFHGEMINDYFPIDWARTQEMATAVYKDRLYFAYADTNGANILAVRSFDTGRWYFFDHPVKSLFHEEDVDQLVAGFADGIVYILESPSATDDNGNTITLSFETPERSGFGQRRLRKRFDYLTVESEGAWTIELYVNDQLRATKTVTGIQENQLMRLPDGILGHRYYLKPTTTDTTAKFHSAEILMWPLEAA